MQVLIIEDEPRAAGQLERLLQVSGLEFTLVDVLDSVEDTVSWFRSHTSPDLVFMDIQLADGLSFEIFQKVEVESPIIFTTAFDQYAIQAFKVNSVDYLLKPIQQADLDQALKKFQRNKSSVRLDPNLLSSLIMGMKEVPKREGVLVKEGRGYIQLQVKDLLYIYSESSITMGVTKDKRYIIDETLDTFYDTLDRDQFFKINRGQVISKRAVMKIEPYLNHRLKLSLETSREAEFVVSRQRTGDFKKWVNS